MPFFILKSAGLRSVPASVNESPLKVDSLRQPAGLPRTKQVALRVPIRVAQRGHHIPRLFVIFILLAATFHICCPHV